MSRTRKDILVVGRGILEVKDAVQKWFDENKVEVIDSNASFMKGRWGTGFLTAPKYFMITFVPIEGGVKVQTEGWITVYWLKEVEFSSSAAVAGGFPRREGMKALERLWSTLETLSKNLSAP